MSTLNISIPEAMREWIDAQVESGVYANASDYMRDLIRHDQRHRESIRQALIKGEQSGFIDQKVPEILAELQRKNA